MASVFSRIIAGELPGQFVWRDDDVVAFLSVAPLTPGHTLVVPRVEVDRWTDLPADLLGRCLDVARLVGQAVTRAFSAPRAGLVAAGFEVPHTHFHVFPAWGMADFDFGRAAPLGDPGELAGPAGRIRKALREMNLREMNLQEFSGPGYPQL